MALTLLLFAAAEWSRNASQKLRETRLKKPNSSRGEGGKPRVTASVAPKPNVTAELPKAKKKLKGVLGVEV